jgi:phosphoglycolate phosphatase
LTLIIFDCDGTLVDSQHMICAAMRQAYEANSLSVPEREHLLSIVGLSLPDAFRRLAARAAAGVDHPVDSLVTCYKAAFATLRQSDDHLEPLYPGAREAIEALAARPDTLLGIATGKSQRGVRAVLGRHGLLERFATIQTSDDAPSKPHPGMVLAAMRETGAAPQDTVVVGDTVFDLEMARAAGARAIGVAWGYHPTSALLAAGAHAMVEGFAELLPTLDRLWGEAVVEPTGGSAANPKFAHTSRRVRVRTSGSKAALEP